MNNKLNQLLAEVRNSIDNYLKAAELPDWLQKERVVPIQMVDCENCEGDGTVPVMGVGEWTCPVCKGKGAVPDEDEIGSSFHLDQPIGFKPIPREEVEKVYWPREFLEKLLKGHDKQKPYTNDPTALCPRCKGFATLKWFNKLNNVDICARCFSESGDIK